MFAKYCSQLLFLAFAVVFFNVQLCAQKKWNVEIRPAVNFPCKVEGGLPKHVGFGLEGKTFFNISKVMGTYFGWGWNLYPANNRSDFSYEETGFTYGLQYMHPTHLSNPGYFIAAGGVYNHIEVESADNHTNVISRRRSGWQIESGITVSIFGKFLLRPGVRYRNIHAGGLQYFSLGTGFFF